METTSRFSFTSETKIASNIGEVIPKNTIQKVKWAMNLLQSWFAEWKVQTDDSLCFKTC